jgi:cell division protein ZapB
MLLSRGKSIQSAELTQQTALRQYFMNNELLHHLEQRINGAVEEIQTLRQRISELEMQNYELSEERDELKTQLNEVGEKHSNWENSLSNMLNRLNQLDHN